MSKWSFKAVKLNTQGEGQLVDLSPAQEACIPDYVKVLETATGSTVANPSFSGYFVKEGIGLPGGEPIRAGNIEYGFCQALHGEESAVAAFRANHGRNAAEKPILGIIAGSPGNIATPCGNCRDILLKDLGEDFEIVSGAAEGGIAVVAKMSDYLFSAFHKLPLDRHFEPVIQTAIHNGELLVNDAYSPKDKHPERRYHALICAGEHYYFGARDIMCEYHPIYALRDAIRQARRANNPFVSFVVIVCEDFGGGPPHVMYKDRQHLLELNLQAELLLGKEQNPPVHLATYDGITRKITGHWETNIKEWLPLPFSPRNFGPEFIEHLTQYYRRLHNQGR